MSMTRGGVGAIMERVAALSGLRWSSDVGQADWIAARFSPWAQGAATMVVPGGFEAYARVLHPVREAGPGEPPVRWADVARWSGRGLRPDVRFHSVALPPADPGVPPLRGNAPREGTLVAPDAEAVAALGRRWTATPDDCWFCVWDGFGWDGAVALTAWRDGGQPAGPASRRLADPVPHEVREGPRVRLPNRDYLLYRGPAEAVSALAGLDGPNLWWPADHAWCVATEIDLDWTYVGGPHGLVDALLSDERVEALPAQPGDPVYRVEEWVKEWAGSLAAALLEEGEASLTTVRGVVRARLRRRGHARRAQLSIELSAPGEEASAASGTTLSGDEEQLRHELDIHLTHALLDLARL